jgi:hypothetical protein
LKNDSLKDDDEEDSASELDRLANDAFSPNQTPIDAFEPEPEKHFDPFVPFDDLPPEREDILTVRAVVTGLVFGGLVNASNVYLSLKSGWTQGAGMFAVGHGHSSQLPKSWLTL